MDKFKGEIHHSSFWPASGVDVKGKRVAVIGTGSTGVQIAQETSKEAASITQFVRTPNLCLPMRQKPLTKEEQEKRKQSEYEEIFKKRLTTFAGFSYDYVQKYTFEDSPEEREAFYEKLWENGGFEFWLVRNSHATHINFKLTRFPRQTTKTSYMTTKPTAKPTISGQRRPARGYQTPRNARFSHRWSHPTPSARSDRV